MLKSLKNEKGEEVTNLEEMKEIVEFFINRYIKGGRKDKELS